MKVATFMLQTGLKADDFLNVYRSSYKLMLNEKQTFLSYLWPELFRIHFINKKFKFYKIGNGHTVKGRNHKFWKLVGRLQGRLAANREKLSVQLF